MGHQALAERPDRLQISRSTELPATPTIRSPPCAVTSPRNAPFGRQHHTVENRRRAGDTARIAERRAIEVADPDADGDVPGIPDRPVVVVRLRCSGLHRDRERELEVAAAPEDVFAGLGVGEDVGDPERRPLTTRLRRASAVASVFRSSQVGSIHSPPRANAEYAAMSSSRRTSALPSVRPSP